MRNPGAVLFFAALLVCSGTLAEAVPVPDPAGDAVAGGGSFLDIASVDAVYGGGALTVTMMFFLGPGTPITPPSSGLPFSLVGGVEFDTDQSPVTGALPFQDPFRPGILHPVSGLGVEFGADLFSEALHAGLIDILAPTLGGAIVGTVPIVYMPLGITFTVPLAMLGGDDGLLDYAAIIGDLSGPTDAAPAVSGTSSPVPEPGTLLLLLSGSVALAAGAWRRFRGV